MIIYFAANQTYIKITLIKLMLQAKQLGFSDTQIARVVQSTETAVRLVLVLEI